MRAITCSVLDEKVLGIFRKIEADPSAIQGYIKKAEPEKKASDPQPPRQKIAACEARIARLTASLSEAEGSLAMKYIVAEIERQDLELQALKREEELAKVAKRRADAERRSIEDKAAEIARLIRGFEQFSDKDKNTIVNDVVDSCVWDGETLFLKL